MSAAEGKTYVFPPPRGHTRSVSHGGGGDLLPVLKKKTHVRAASQGASTVLEENNLKERAASRTEFTLPPSHTDRISGGGSGEAWRSHSRQASRSESIYTLRQQKSPGKSRFFFWRRVGAEEGSQREVYPNTSLPPPDLSMVFAGNEIRTTKYTAMTFLPLNLFEQFHRFANLYFISIVLLNWIPAISAFGKEIAMLPVVFVLGVTAIKDLFEDRRRSTSDKAVNNLSSRVFSPAEDNFIGVKWRDIHVGDVVRIHCDERIPADVLVLRSSESGGLCYIETMNLDGESSLKQREAIGGMGDKEGKDFRAPVRVGPPTTKMYHFHGTVLYPEGECVAVGKEHLLLRGATLKNTDYVEALVVYAGRETKAMLNNGGPRHKRTGLERMMNLEVMWCVVILGVLCLVGAVGSTLWLASFPQKPPPPFLIVYEESHGFTDAVSTFLTFIIILQVMIPLSLYVTIELTKLLQIYHIQADRNLFDPESNKRIECRAMNIPEDLGQIQYVFSDKTGTLTENQMLFRRCSVGGRDYVHAKVAPNAPAPRVAANSNLQEAVNSGEGVVKDFFRVLSLCNTVVVPKSQDPPVDDLSPRLSPISEADSPVPPVPATRRPRFLPTRPLSPIPSSDEGTPTTGDGSPLGGHSPRPLFLHIGRLPLLGRLGRGEESPGGSPPSVRPLYEAESPDELALVEAAFAYDIKLVGRGAGTIRLNSNGRLTNFDLLHTFPFDSVRKRMSVLVRDPSSHNVILLSKGADSAIIPRLRRPQSTMERERREATIGHVEAYAKEGLRILLMGQRSLTLTEYEEWRKVYKAAMDSMDNRERRLYEAYARLEENFELVGATGIEDRLQDGVPQTIEALRKAGIVVWVLTGDKEETALNVAFSSKLFSPSMEVLHICGRTRDETERVLNSALLSARENPTKGRALVIDGRTLTYILDRRTGLVVPFLSLARLSAAVLCARSTPLQKAVIVTTVKDELGMKTLAIGDGANDVSMIQRADVGVGISGKEGMQAVMASDFAISKFRFLERLLLVHGHWSYDRLARMILYFFYKNAAFVFVIFWYQLLNGWSGSVMVDQVYLMVFNLFFTALPPIALGVYDQDASADLLLALPDLYTQGRLSLVHQPHSFWLNMLDALYQSVVIFFVAYGTYAGTDVGMGEFGTTIVVSCMITMLGHMAVESRSWTWLHGASLAASVAAFYIFAFSYNSICASCLGYEAPYKVIHRLIGSPTHWLCVVLTTVLALIPRLSIRSLEASLRPGLVTRGLLAERDHY